MKNKGHKVLAIGGTNDHVHVFFGLNASQAVSDLMMLVKRDSSKWVRENRFVTGEFRWQSGYGAFSYSQSQIDSVVKYIENQETHHVTRSFLDEYKKILDDLGIEYKEQYILE